MPDFPDIILQPCKTFPETSGNTSQPYKTFPGILDGILQHCNAAIGKENIHYEDVIPAKVGIPVMRNGY